MHIIFKYFLIIFLFLICSVKAYTQTFEPIWSNFGTNNGLPSSETYEILQDKKGYIWISTDNGLSRYDGYNFKNYGPRDGLKDPVVFCLREDDNGEIWMNSLSGKVYILSSNLIRPYKYNSIIAKFNKSPFLIPLFEVKEGVLFISLHGVGILKIDRNGKYELIKNYPPSLDILKVRNKKLINIHGDFGYKNKLINLAHFYEKGSPEKGKYNFVLENNKWTIPNIFALNDSIEIICLNFFIEVHINHKFICRIKDPDLTFISIIQDENGLIYSCNRNRKGIRVFQNINDFIRGKYYSLLEGNNISFILKDRNGGFWAASNDKGIFYTRDLNMEQLKNNSVDKNDEIISISNIVNNSFCVGYQSGILSSYYISSNNFKTLKFKNTYPISDIYIDDISQNIYLTNQIGTYYLDKSIWKGIYRWMPDINSYVNMPVRKFWYKNEIHDLVATVERGFIKVNRENHLPYYFSPISSKGKIPTMRTICTFKSRKGELYIGAINGLFLVENDSLVRIKNHNLYLELRIEAIDELLDSSLVIGTKGAGIIILNKNQYIQISEKYGLTSNMIENIFIDSKDNIWVGTLLGLNKIYKIENKWKVEKYTAQNGLPSNEIIKVVSSNGVTWCLTNKGLVRIKQSSIRNSIVPIIISEYYINDKLLNKSENLVLKYFENNIRLKIDCLNFRMNGKIPYRFKLKSEEDWKETDERLINLYSLPPGIYNLQIQAKNEDGIWSKSAFFPFTISPPWWKSWQFYLIMSILLAFLIAFIIKNRLNVLKNKIAIQKQINELEQSAKKAQMNPHFLFNALNSIQSQIITGNTKEATHFLSAFGHLVRRVLDMSLKNSIALESDIEYIKKYLELEQLRFKNRFLYEFTISPDINTAKIFVPPMLVQPFVENAIIHGISKINGGGLIKITYQKFNEYLKIIIIDNGVGLNFNSNKEGPQKSVGISNTKRRLELLDELKNSKLLNMEEIKDSAGNVKGSKVTILIKIQTVDSQ